VNLEKDGTATVYERWDVNTGENITEWYLVRENLGDIVIDSLEVRVDDVPLRNEGDWNVDRTLEEKAGRCGIVHKKDGVELCWGIGSYGDHVFEALYLMHGAVKSARDYDYLHLQLISPGLSTPPEQVRVFIGSHETQLDTTVARVWGFGYEGICIFEDGRVVVENDHTFGTDDSVIVLLRLDKGLLEPTSVRDQDFQEVLDRAMMGADFGTDEEDDTVGLWILGILSALIGGGILGYHVDKKRKESPNYLYRKILGIRRKDITWFRDIPFNGSLPSAKYVMGLLGEGSYDTGPLASALILRMVYNGYLEVSRLQEKKNTDVRFTLKDPADLDPLSLKLYKMLRAAAGENKILEKNEFSKWAKAHSQECYEWYSEACSTGKKSLQENGWLGDMYDKLTPEGKAEGIHLLGLRKFLMEFTLTQQREAIEAHLWKEYLVYGAILGIARTVAGQLKEIAPNAVAAVTLSSDFSHIVRTYSAQYIRKTAESSRSSYSSSGRSSHSYSASSSRSGYGGRSSHHGGGGHSSGGRGGGGR